MFTNCSISPNILGRCCNCFKFSSPTPSGAGLSAKDFALSMSSAFSGSPLAILGRRSSSYLFTGEVSSTSIFLFRLVLTGPCMSLYSRPYLPDTIFSDYLFYTRGLLCLYFVSTVLLSLMRSITRSFLFK